MALLPGHRHHVPGVWISTLLISSYFAHSLRIFFQPFVAAALAVFRFFQAKHFCLEFVTTLCNCCDVSVSQFPCFLRSEVVIIELYHLDQLPCLIIIQFLPQIEVSNTANWNFLIDYLTFYRITNINSHTVQYAPALTRSSQSQDTQLSYVMKSLDILMNTETLSRKQRGLSYNNTVEYLWCLVFFAVCVLCCHIVGLGWRRCYLLIFANPSQLWGLIPHYTSLVERKMKFYSHKVRLRSFGTVWEVWATREGLCKKYQVVVCFSFHRTESCYWLPPLTPSAAGTGWHGLGTESLSLKFNFWYKIAEVGDKLETDMIDDW